MKKKERVVEYSDDEDEDDDDAERTGSRKYYKHFPPFALADETEEFLYLHSIEMKLGELMLIQNECSLHFTFSSASEESSIQSSSSRVGFSLFWIVDLISAPLDWSTGDSLGIRTGPRLRQIQVAASQPQS